MKIFLGRGEKFIWKNSKSVLNGHLSRNSECLASDSVGKIRRRSNSVSRFNFNFIFIYPTLITVLALVQVHCTNKLTYIASLNVVIIYNVDAVAVVVDLGSDCCLVYFIKLASTLGRAFQTTGGSIFNG